MGPKLISRIKTRGTLAPTASVEASTSACPPVTSDHLAKNSQAKGAKHLFDKLREEEFSRRCPNLALKLKKIAGAVLGELERSVEQLTALNVNKSKLSVEHRLQERKLELALASISYRAVCEATALSHEGALAELAMTDSMTLMKGKAYFGRLLEVLGSVDATGLHVAWAVAEFENLNIVSDYWSHPHADGAVLFSCHKIVDLVHAWNSEHEDRAYCVPMRLGGEDEISVASKVVLAFILRDEGLAGCRQLVDKLHREVGHGLGERYPFASLNHRLEFGSLDGPSMPIALSSATHCGPGRVYKVLAAYKRSGDLLREWTVKWRAVEKDAIGRGVVFYDDVIDAAEEEVLTYLRTLDQQAGQLCTDKGTRMMSAKVDAASALRELASENEAHRAAIVRAGGMEALFRLCREGSVAAKEEAAAAIRNLASSEEHKKVIVKAGGMDVLLDLLRSGGDKTKEHVAGALMGLSVNTETAQIAIARADGHGIEALVALLVEGSDKARERAAGAIRNLARSAENRLVIAKSGGVEALVPLLTEGSLGAKEHAAAALWSLSVNENIEMTIIEAGGLHKLVQLICDDEAPMIAKEEAAGAIRNLTINPDHQAELMAEDGQGVEALVGLLYSGSPGAQEQVAGALMGIAVRAENRKQILSAGAMPALLVMLRGGTDLAKERAAGAVRNLVVDTDNSDLLATDIIAVLTALLESGDDKTKVQAAGVIRNLAVNLNGQLATVDASVLSPLVYLSNSGIGPTQEAAIGALQALASNEVVRGKIIREGGANALRAHVR